MKVGFELARNWKIQLVLGVIAIACYAISIYIGMDRFYWAESSALMSAGTVFSVASTYQGRRKWKSDTLPNYFEWFWQTRSIFMKMANALGVFLIAVYLFSIKGFYNALEMEVWEIAVLAIPALGFGIAILLQPYYIYKKLVRSDDFSKRGSVYDAVKLKKDRDTNPLLWYNTESDKRINKDSYKVIKHRRIAKTFVVFREPKGANYMVREQDVDIIKIIAKK